MMNDLERRIQHLLETIYGEDQAASCWKEIQRHVAAHLEMLPEPRRFDPMNDTSWRAFSEADAVLITYGDQFFDKGRKPLSALADFLDTWLEGLVNTVHILPFYPYTSDDGFSVTDYWQVNPELGDWADISRLGRNYRLMFDGVINHISRSSEWFRRYVAGDPDFLEYFIEMDPKTDLSMTVRPRTLPLLTEVETSRGARHVWSTFSDDQIDLNYQNPKVLIKIIELLLFYIRQGASVVRLDAIAYLWKQPGTASIHLSQTHAIVKILRAVCEMAGSGLYLITETNVPHEENISYFGDRVESSKRFDEAHLVYQFPLAPLVADAIFSGDASTLSAWAATLKAPSPGTTFFNFIASHDGIGLMPARGLLAESAIEALIHHTIQHGGQVSYKTNPDGTTSVYELNITLFDLLNDPADSPNQLAIDRFLASQFVLLSLVGVPGIYIHSLLGSKNCDSCVEQTGRARSINREKLSLAQTNQLLQDTESLNHKIFNGYAQMLRIRRGQAAFRPASPQMALNLAPPIFGLVRGGTRHPPVICLANLSSNEVPVELSEQRIPSAVSRGSWIELLSKQRIQAENGRLKLRLVPYQRLWVTLSTD